MANNLLTTAMITREALRLFRNSNNFLKKANTQYDSYFAKTGAKIGNTINIRLPNDYVVGNGPTITPQNTIERKTSLSITNQFNVAMSFSSADKALSLDDFSKRIIAPAVNRLAGIVAVSLMSTVDGGGTGGQGPAQHLVHNVDTNGNTITPTAATILQGGAILTSNGAPDGRGDRIGVLGPISEARLVAGMAGYFNPQSKISDQFETGMITKDTLGFDFYHDQTVLSHLTGTFSATANTVNGANQTGNSIAVGATTGTLYQGDVITVAGVYGVNYITGASTGALRQFSVTANVPAGSTSIPIYPSLIPTGSSAGLQVAYGTVTTSPASGAVVSLVNNPGEIYRNNLLFVPEAFTLATADLELPGGVDEAHRETYDGISMRMVSQYAILSDQFITRLDILCGMALVRPEWVVRLADAQ